MGKGRSNLLLGAMCLGFAGASFSVPYFLRKNSENLSHKGKLSGSQRQRGMYFNQGTDAGVDPDWDPVNQRWTGFDKKD